MSAAVLSLLLADSRTPTGGYAHSAGLEPAVLAGLAVWEVPAFLQARLQTVAFVEAAFAAAACTVQRGSPPPGGGQIRSELLALDDELAARTASAPLRAAARQLGRALLRVGARAWPEDRAVAAYARESAWTPRAVAFGVVAAAAGLDPLSTARLSLYEDAAGVAAAAVKLLPLDAAETTAWIAAAAERIEALAQAAAAHAEAARAALHAESLPATAHPPAAAPPPAPTPLPVAALPATSTPLLDLRSLDHQRFQGRLFVT